jgi:hypothetical protein
MYKRRKERRRGCKQRRRKIYKGGRGRREGANEEGEKETKKKLVA